MGPIESFLREDCATGKHLWNWHVQDISDWTKEIDGVDIMFGELPYQSMQIGYLECDKCLVMKKIKRYRIDGKIRCKYGSAIWEKSF